MAVKMASMIVMALVLCFATPVAAAERLHWYIQQGKGRPLCENLVRIANANPTIDITPNIPWKQVLAIKGIREPKWTEVDPLKYEDFFLKAWKFIAAQKTYEEQVIPFVLWFLPPKDRWVEESVRRAAMSDKAALKIYRDFARRGGKLKVFRHYIFAEKDRTFMDFVQYESPDKDFSAWDGYSVQAKPGLSGIHDAGYPITSLGRGYRILIYKNDLFSFVGFRRGDDEYQVNQLSGERGGENSPYYPEFSYCKIDSEVIKRRNKK